MDMNRCNEKSTFHGKKVLITGHTGFKGSWLSLMLLRAGAQVVGYSLAPSTKPSLYQILGLQDHMESVIGDIRDLEKMRELFQRTRPEIVFHLAAQPIVRTGYQEPVYTYEVNVMGTVNILECIRTIDRVQSFLNVTTDKVYLNDERTYGFKEDEKLDGFDPYSNSKSCSELVTHCYKNSFFMDGRVPISTARAGNVIGGGDFAKDRIIPDCIRAVWNQKPIIVRNPYSIRPFQHVLEPLNAYLMIAGIQIDDGSYAGWYNVGPEDADCINTGKLADLFCRYWGEGASWINQHDDGPHEANFLRLDSSKLWERFQWKPVWHIDTAVEKTVEWAKAYRDGEQMRAFSEKQILEYSESKMV